MRTAHRHLVVVATAIVLASCTPGTSPADPSADAATPARPSPGTPSASAGALASPAPSPNPNPSGVIGTWVAPDHDGIVHSTELTLAARPAAGIAVRSVTFSATWGSKAAVALCTALAADPDGSWSCTADLAAHGIPLGTATLRFDVFDAIGLVSAVPAVARTIALKAAPPKPTDTTYVLVKEIVSKDQVRTTERYRATWSEPDGYATSFRVYGVTECLRESEQNDNTPCVVPGMQIPASKLKLLGTASGDARSMNVTWTRYGEEGPDPYWAILLSAANQYGESKSAILFSGLVCFGCAY